MHVVASLNVLLLHAVATTAARLPAVTMMSAPHSTSSLPLPSGNPFARRGDVGGPDTGELSTCGYLDGNVNAPRTAQPGFDCRVDTAHGIWGFCPTTVIAATDCGLAAACKDSGTCASICRVNPDPDLTTFTCSISGTSTGYCSTAMLTFGVDQTYAYLACGHSPKTNHYAISPTFTPSPSSSSSTTSTSATTTSTATPKTVTSVTSPTSAASSPHTSSTSLSAVATPPQPMASDNSSHSSNTTTINGNKNSDTSTTGAIIGGVIGGLALVCASAVVVVFILRRGRSKNSRNNRSSDGSYGGSSGGSDDKLQDAFHPGKPAAAPLKPLRPVTANSTSVFEIEAVSSAEKQTTGDHLYYTCANHNRGVGYVAELPSE